MNRAGFQISLIFQWKPIFQIALASGMNNMGAKYVQESDLLIWVQNIFRNLTHYRQERVPASVLLDTHLPLQLASGRARAGRRSGQVGPPRPEGRGGPHHEVAGSSAKERKSVDRH